MRRNFAAVYYLFYPIRRFKFTGRYSDLFCLCHAGAGHVFATTMCTGNLRSATEMLFMFLKTRDHTLLKHGMKYYAIIGIFILGAAAGSFITTLIREIAVSICCGILAVVFIMMFIQERGQKNLKQQNPL